MNPYMDDKLRQGGDYVWDGIFNVPDFGWNTFLLRKRDNN